VKRIVVLCLAVAVVVAMVFLPKTGLGSQFPSCTPRYGGVVDKSPAGAFVVEIAFKNSGMAEGAWSVNVAFESEKWVWLGTSQNLTLKPDSLKTLVWNGSVPSNAPVDSVARLIVYYDDSYKSLDWWIHVVPGAELSITSSKVN
jgi:hypothetical protein